ncbi:hypothetical protein [Longispora fulva]|uniref:Uncharacterized protein n=2 Tax=Longispora fulva TaxID=619741 RepID=A0A8J7GBD3_9ACTN|nr:hypothetical protein [Longispora fulva]MBG6137313.1 hypothetical protein [Longispora fulva]
MTRPLRRYWTAGRPIERTAYLVGAVLMLWGAAHAVVFLLDDRPWAGPLSWRKPTTFGLSFGLTLISTAWVATTLPLAERTRRRLLGALTVACVVEVALVSLQAWRHVPSHFNMETPLNTVISQTLAAGGFALVTIYGTLTAVSFRANPAVSRSTRLAVRVGLVLLMAALGIGAAMIVRGVTAVYAGNPHLAYTTAGALKPAHAITLHAILVLPALVWLLSGTRWRESVRHRIVTVAATCYLVASFAVLLAVIR